LEFGYKTNSSTGGTGYIGSHTVVELVQAGYEVIVLDNLSNSREEVLQALKKITGKEIPFQNIDLCDKSKVENFFATNKVRCDHSFCCIQISE